MDAVEWARRGAELGAGEILLTSMDRDGTRIGYDLPLLKAVTAAVPIPVIASGGVGELEHLRQGLCEGNADAALAALPRPLPVFADESVHGLATLPALAGRYDAINIKLDKTGGLTEALALVAEAERLSLGVIVGCMVATSLAMAPATLLTPRARYVDLDGPLLLARDRPEGLTYAGSVLHPPSAALWG